jgi:cytochrome P450 family 6
MEIVKKVMIKDFDHFKNRGFGDPDNMHPESNKHFKTFLTVLHDDKWKSMRNMMTPIFTSGKIKATLPLVNEAAFALTKYLESLESLDNINAKEQFSKFTGEVLGKLACGIEPNVFTSQNDNEYYKQVLTDTTYS